MNWVDFLFLLFVAFYAYRGYHRGLFHEGVDLVGVVLGGLIAIRFYSIPGAVLRFIGVGKGLSNVIGGALIFTGVLVGTGLVARRLHRKYGPPSPPLKAGGAAFASIWSAVLAAFLLVLALVVPTPSSVQTSMRDSLLGRTLLAPRSPLYSALEGYAKNDARNMLFYLKQYFARLEPQKSRDPTQCFKLQASKDIAIDSGAEAEILDLVNRERAQAGLSSLKLHIGMRRVARSHSADMYQRGFFCHANPDGEDPFARMQEGGVEYTFAGENLALAPTVAMAHRGLMNSPRHRDNIMKPEFTDLGIGVYKGPLGLMVTQNFCSRCG